jgi:two-component system, NtrC family, response regulator AtoC
MPDTILVIDDEPAIRHAIKRAFSQYEVIEADTGQGGLEQTRDGFPDLVLLDQVLPDGDGLDQIGSLRAIDPELPIVLMTGHGSVDLAVEALKVGAVDFIEKPFRIEHLRANVEVLLDRQRLGRQVKRLVGKGRARTNLIAHAPAMKRVVGLIKRVAAVPSTTVLIQGESGVGKELVARSIHERSARNAKEFIAINCAALSEHLLEAELFGYEKGAFTGADAKGKEGLFQAAEGGTIFLDEIGEMPLQLQTKLLRVLQERCIRKVGGLQDIDVDIRVVAATNRDLRQEVVAGRFRQDLYYRLRVIPVNVPPLRERREDVLPLAKYLLDRLGPELGRDGLAFTERAKEAMQHYAWPGNVREMANAVERSVISCIGNQIGIDDLCMDEILPVQPGDGADGHSGPALPAGSLVIEPARRNLAAIEAQVIRAVMQESGGRKTQAAEMLGINRTTLYNKLRELGDGDANAE